MGEAERVAVVCMRWIFHGGGDDCERMEIYMILGGSEKAVVDTLDVWILCMLGGYEMFGWFFYEGQRSMRRFRVCTHRIGFSSTNDHVGLSSTCLNYRDTCMKYSKR